MLDDLDFTLVPLNTWTLEKFAIEALQLPAIVLTIQFIQFAAIVFKVVFIGRFELLTCGARHGCLDNDGQK